MVKEKNLSNGQSYREGEQENVGLQQEIWRRNKQSQQMREWERRWGEGGGGKEGIVNQ